MLLANKSDLEIKQIAKEQGEGYATKNKMMFMETSAKKDIQVSSAFEKMAERLIELKYLYNNNRSTKAEKKDVTINININQTIKGGVESVFLGIIHS